MTDLLNNLSLGLATVATPANLFFCLLGCLLGTLVGVLPGIGPLAAITILLPITYHFGDTTTSLIMLAGIYYGSQYGGSTTSILINLPGESSSMITTLDGHQMARQGRAGVALATAALASFFAGTVATAIIAAFAPPLASIAFQFGPAEYFCLMLLALISSVVLSNGSVLKALAMTVIGILIGTVGVDINSGTMRYNFGIAELSDGISFAVVAMSLFGFSEIIYNIRHAEDKKITKTSSYRPTSDDIRQGAPAAVRGTMIGSFLGLLPGGGALLASLASYAFEKKVSRDPKKFGKGAIEGVAAPEAANNAGAQTSFIPMLTLGIPSNPVMALMIAAMIIHNVQPGPTVMTSNPSLFWGLIVSMWLGNVMLLILNLPLIGIWVKLLTVPGKILYPVILFFSCVGVYAFNNNVWDLLLAVPFTLLGYFLRRWNCEPAPLLMGLIVGVLVEEYMRRALLISRGDWSIFVQSNISLTLLALSGLLLLLLMLPGVKKIRESLKENR